MNIAAFSFPYLLLRHGYLFVFVYVLAVQVGLPLPADPLLLIMGSLVGVHRYSFLKSVLTAVSAAVAGDWMWYEIGRIRGRSVVRLLCRLSLEPDTCVRKTELTFAKRGASALLFAKFVPGISLVSMPLAGMSGMPRGKFLLADCVGTLLWTCTYLSLGALFHRQVSSLVMWLGLFGRRAGLVILCLIALYLALKLYQRQRVLRDLRINRITPQAAYELLKRGDPMTIVDLRHPSDVERDPFKMPGALVIRPDELRSRSGEIPTDQETILYCT